MNRACLNNVFRVLALFLIVLIGSNLSAEEVKVEPKKTQENQQTDLFERSIENLQEVQDKLRTGKNNIINSIENYKDTGGPGLYSLEEIEEESKKLEQLNEHELEARGQEEMIKTKSIDTLYRDETLPGNKAYVKDAKRIANAQANLLNNILGSLEKLGIECKSANGSTRHEPEFYLNIGKEQIEDTKYNQVFCEQLRNLYDCTNYLKVSCKRKGRRLGEPEKKIYTLDWLNLRHSKGHWWFWTHQGAHTVWNHIKINEPGIVQEIKNYITNTLINDHNYAREQIGQDMVISETGYEELWAGRGRKKHVRYFSVSYNFRTWISTCEEWQDEWSEECLLN